ncbi:MAG: hypothetical protein KIT31_33190 [Deltaproteobacteria bacterium]|nr:hypothetical protein [Deltaproteobacteria bacterium]
MSARAIVAMLVLGCSGGAGKQGAPTTRSPPRTPAAEPTLGICADGRSAGAAGAPALLEAARAALGRGCPYEAMLDAVAARDAGGGLLAELAIQEAGQDALSTRLVGIGQGTALGSDLPDEAWVKVYDPMSFDPIERLALGVRAGKVPKAVRDEGRLARLVVRFAPTPCLFVNDRVSPVEMKKLGQDMRKSAFAEFGAELLGDDATAMSRMIATSHQWACDFAAAASAFDDVARTEAKADRAASALEARLTAWEQRHFLDGLGGLRSEAPGPTRVR